MWMRELVDKNDLQRTNNKRQKGHKRLPVPLCSIYNVQYQNVTTF